MKSKATGHVWERNGRWLAKVELPRDPTGKRRYSFTRHATQREAYAKLEEVSRQLGEHRYVGERDSRKLTVNVWLDEWLDQRKGHVSPATLMHYGDQLMHARRLLGAARLADLDFAAVQAWLAKLVHGYSAPDGRSDGKPRTVRLSDSSVRVVRTVFAVALQAAVQQHRIAANPMLGAKAPRREALADARDDEAADEHKAFTRGEVSRLLAYLRAEDSEFYAPCVLAEATGLRGQEVWALRWCDVELDGAQGAVRVRHAVESQGNGATRLKEPKTKGSRRAVPFSGPAVAELVRHRAKHAQLCIALGVKQADTAFVFPANADPMQMHCPKAQSARFIRIARRLGMRPGFHGLRHYHATALLADGERVEVVSKRLGHADVGITLNTYAGVLKDAEEKAAARAARISADVHENAGGTVTRLRKSN